MTSFALKLIAVISMFCDHLGDAFTRKYSFFNLIGRIAFPIFAFTLSQGYIHTKNRKKYFIRLTIFALISQIPFSLFLNKFLPTSDTILNIGFTLLLGFISMVSYDYFSNIDSAKLDYKLFGVKIKNMIGVLSAISIASIGQLIHVDYGFFGVIVPFTFYLLKDHKISMFISYIILCIFRYGYMILLNGFHMVYIRLLICTITPIFLILLYNGKQGIKIKYLLYIFYPLHLMLLYLFL